jgi:hypothetical protein
LSALCGTFVRLGFATLLKDRQDCFLDIRHYTVCPVVGVPIEIRGNGMLAGQVQSNASIRKRLDPVFAAKHIEAGSADVDVIIKCCRWNLIL